MDNFELQDNIQALLDIQSYEIPNEHEVSADNAATILEGKHLWTIGNLAT
jgi:hypothetical protein